ncbi:MAG: 3-dehydroquinate dehydratase [Clostridiales bacterium]|jgi:3-dehydroquinate dehydratase-2|nr:3-dehydroquinate dehydratase [Clostridiales bacterium]
MKKILVINGPNLNMLGKRDPAHYGTITYAELCAELKRRISALGYEAEIFQSNHEGFIIDRIQSGGYNSIVINAGALTHYSYALRDALEIVGVPKLEVHMSDVANRDAFRRISVITEVCDGVFTGGGADSYYQAVNAAHGLMKKEKEIE